MWLCGGGTVHSNYYFAFGINLTPCTFSPLGCKILSTFKLQGSTVKLLGFFFTLSSLLHSHTNTYKCWTPCFHHCGIYEIYNDTMRSETILKQKRRKKKRCYAKQFCRKLVRHKFCYLKNDP